MWVLFTTAITTSFFDSLNPSAIAQQMLLQAMVRTKRLIWFFILGIGAANLALGLAIYYGIAAWISALLSKAIALYPQSVYGAALLAGILCLLIGIRQIIKTRRRTGSSYHASSGTKKPAQLSPASLFTLGAAFCAVELTSAFPYFGFLAILSSYDLIFPLVLFFIMIYNAIYIFPLVLLYFGYNKLQGTPLIQRIELVLGKISSYVVPTVVTLLGALLFCWGMYAFFL